LRLAPRISKGTSASRTLSHSRMCNVKSASGVIGFIFCLVVCVTASASEMLLGTTRLTLPAPAGQCELDRANPKDARLLALFENLVEGGPNRILATYVKCDQLKSWRSGSHKFEIYAQYQTLEKMVDKQFPPNNDMLRQTCSLVRAQENASIQRLPRSISERAEKTIASLELDQLTDLGVVANGGDACYTSTLRKSKDRSGIEKTQISIMAFSIIKGKPIYFYIFAPYTTGIDAQKLLSGHIKDTTMFIEANRSEKL
jgi:hypothetical protein